MRICRHGGSVFASALVASLCSTSPFSARAADLAPILYPSAYFNWAGLYGGLNVGGGVGNTSFSVNAPGLFTAASDEIRGFVGGGQAGYNWQFGAAVLGVEGDLEYSHQQNSVWVNQLVISNGTDFISTLRGRVGFAGIEDWLFYATAGGGYIHNVANYDLGAFGGFQKTDFSPMWVAGAGVETRVSGRWTGRLEYLYLSGGSTNTSFGFPDGVVPGFPGGTLTVNRNIHDSLIRTGLNYYF
jgi:outer membrane immunogenic protein